jgi:hypothetical protein
LKNWILFNMLRLAITKYDLSKFVITIFYSISTGPIKTEVFSKLMGKLCRNINISNIHIYDCYLSRLHTRSEKWAASSAIDRWFEPRSVQTKDHTIGICSFSAKHQSLRSKSKDWLLGIRITCPSGAKCLPSDWCFSELAL